MEMEVIRNSLRSVSGKFDLPMGGTSIFHIRGGCLHGYR